MKVFMSLVSGRPVMFGGGAAHKKKAGSTCVGFVQIMQSTSFKRSAGSIFSYHFQADHTPISGMNIFQ